MKANARPMNEENKKAIFYQIFLRAMTDEGTLDAARRMLPSIADLGVTVVYLCPIAEADDDGDRAHWSDRQHASGFDNPKNPYRIKDYFRVDPEYGTDEDLDRFVKDAHRLGMRVLLDLVYLHCGPRAVFLDEHPSFIKRDASGVPLYNKWHFPILNFGDVGLRAYLEENLLYFIEKFDVDGYRCDVGDQVPLDFWLAARRKAEALKPSVVMLNEGKRPDYLEEAFDWNYSFALHPKMVKCFADGESATLMREVLEDELDRYPTGARCIRYVDNHDTASDSYNSRYEKRFGEQGMECALAMCYTLRGVPLLYNGNEVCDDSRHSIWSNRDHGKLHVRWENALTPAGMRRRTLLRDLAALFSSHPALYDGDMTFLDGDCPDRTLAYLRSTDGERVAVFLHTGRTPERVTFDLAWEPTAVLRNGGAAWKYEDGRMTVDFPGYGYLVVKV